MLSAKTLSKNILRLYALAVCFVSVLIFSIFFGTSVYDVIQFNLPEVTMDNWHYERYQNNHNFIRDWPSEKPLPADEELVRLREEGYRIAIESEKRDAIQSLLVAGIIMLITAVLFLIHWKLSKTARAE